MRRSDQFRIAGTNTRWRYVRPPAEAVYDQSVPDVSAFVDEVANELATWPGVRIERRADGAAIVNYEQSV